MTENPFSMPNIIFAVAVGVVILLLEYFVIQPLWKWFESRKKKGPITDKLSQPKGARSDLIAETIAWAIVGKADRNLLSSYIRNAIRLLVATVIWAIIGAIIGIALVGLLYVLSLALGITILGVIESLRQYAILGAFGGAVFRSIVWPVLDALFKAIRSRRIGRIYSKPSGRSISRQEFQEDFSKYKDSRKLGENWDYTGVWLIEQDGEGKVLKITDSGVGGIAKPCLSWTDYVFEFDTKIENTCSAWIIRAKDLSEYVMLQCHLDRIRPLFRMNGEWYDLGWTDQNAVHFSQVLSLNIWYHVQITVEGTRVTATIVGDLVGGRMEIADLPSLEHPQAVTSYLVGSVGFRESSAECAYFRNVQVAKIG